MDPNEKVLTDAAPSGKRASPDFEGATDERTECNHCGCHPCYCAEIAALPDFEDDGSDAGAEDLLQSGTYGATR